MWDWIIALKETTAGSFLATMLVSMIPAIESRGGIPFGEALGLSKGVAFLAAVTGNMIPVPFIIVFIRRIFAWMRRNLPRLEFWVDNMEKKAHLKGEKVTKYKTMGLCIFVAVPFPGTGAWTGALIAALLDIRLKKAVPSIFLGVLIASAMMSGLVSVILALF